MKKSYIIVLSIFFGVQVNSFSQNHDEIVDIIGNESVGTYLKDFEIDLEPDKTERYSVVLSKKTKYGLNNI